MPIPSRSPASRNGRPVIGLLIDATHEHGRGILRGIAAYGLAADWQFRRPQAWLFHARPHRERWSIDGLIASNHNDDVRRLVNKLGVPTVNISSSGRYQTMASVVADNAKIGHLAATHYVEQGCQHVAYVGRPAATWSTERRDAFLETAHRHGLQTHVFAHDAARAGGRLADWLRLVRTPVGVFAGNDTIAELVLAAAVGHGLRVPDDVAVLGVDNDELVARMTSPALSSIDTNARQIGHHAAAMLASLLCGDTLAENLVRVMPSGVIARGSSNVLALTDADVAAAVRFIRSRTSVGTNVQDVLAVVPLSRRPLEMRFRRLLGRSILDEIHRVHVERATQLLTDTDLPIGSVARASGFSNDARLRLVFKKVIGHSPAAFRIRNRLDSASSDRRKTNGVKRI